MGELNHPPFHVSYNFLFNYNTITLYVSLVSSYLLYMMMMMKVSKKICLLVVVKVVVVVVVAVR